MSGIVGYNGHKNSITMVMDGLNALEYRGYDSAGIAYQTCNRVEIIKINGKLKSLKNKIKNNITTNLGLGHIRWATSGRPSVINAHPHHIGKFTIVHNGIIENYMALKKILENENYKFKSETDTEVIAALLDKLYSEKNDILKVLNQIKKLLVGTYAIALICDDIPEAIYAIKKDSPLLIGYGNNENFIVSDLPAMLKHTKKYSVLSNNDIAEIKDKINIYNEKLEIIPKDILTYDGDIETAEKNGYEHFMLKEIYEEPKVIKNIVRLFLKFGAESLNNLPDFTHYQRLILVGSGSAYNAGLIGKKIIEKYSNFPISVERSSEFRYSDIYLDKNTLVIFISQSGETIDTLASLKKVKEENIPNLAIVNIMASSIAREADKVIDLKAGPEVAVTTTKAFLSQIAILSLMALNSAYKTKKISSKELDKIINDFEKLPKVLEETIDLNYKNIAKILAKNSVCFYTGRGIDYALSMEGALKLKEIAYINSICDPAGELKHSTISLINNKTPVIGVITDKKIASKTISNIKEVKARGAFVILIVTDNITEDLSCADRIIKVPTGNDFTQSIIATIPLQLISYETAKILKHNIDKPKNLAKAVIVE